MSASTEGAVVHQYRLNPARFARVRRRVIAGLAVFTPLFLAVVWYVDARLDRRHLFDLLFLPAIIGWTIYRQLQQERKKWESLVLELHSDRLIRKLPDYPAFEVGPGDVTTMIESPAGIRILTNSQRKTMLVSTDLIEYGDLRRRLAEWAPITRPSRSIRTSIRRVVMGIASMLLCLVLFGGPIYLMYTPHHELILPLGVALFIGMAAMIWYYRGSPMVPTSFRKTSWILLLLPLLATISRLVWNS